MNKIIIKGAKFLCNVGVPEKERRKKQKIIIDIELFLTKKIAFPSISSNKFFSLDDIKNTVNYLEVYNTLKKRVENKEYRLIEAMAEDIAQEVLSKFSVQKILVRVKKPKAFGDMNVKYTAVEIIRKK